MNSVPKFTIVIATCGRPDRLAEVLRSTACANTVAGGGCKVVVVDNHADLTAEKTVREFAHTGKIPTTYLKSRPHNKCAALNTGIQAALTDWIAFTDDDTIPEPTWLREAARYAGGGSARMFAGRIVPGECESLPRWLKAGKSGRVLKAGVFVHYEPRQSTGLLGPSDAVPYGANVFVHRHIFEEYGVYDEALWRMCGKAALGVDDGEFGIRVSKAGEPIGYCHESVVVHPVHDDRFSLYAQLRIAYRYGWRDPLVFHEEYRHPHFLFRLRLVLANTLGAICEAARADVSASGAHLGEAARNVGRIVGRFSQSYRLRTDLPAPAMLEPEGRIAP